MDTSSISFSNDDPPRASLLGLPVELRQLIYDYVFAPIEHRRKRFINYHREEERIFIGIQGLSVFYHDNGIEQWRDIAFILAGNAEESQRHHRQREHLAALLSVPCVCRQIRRELQDMVSELPPISKIGFVFNDFTRRDMEMFVDAIGETNARHIRKWTINGTARCVYEEYRDGHLLKGCWGRPGPCSFFENGEQQCNHDCTQVPSRRKKGQCERYVAIELDKHEEQNSLLTENTRWRKTPRVENNVKAEDRLHKLKLKLSDEKETAKKALLGYRHAEFSKCWGNRDLPGSCYLSDALDPLFNTDGELRVTKRTFVRMLEAVTGERG